MTLLFTDGFDHTQTALHKWTSGGWAYATTAPRTGARHWDSGGVNTATKQVAIADEHATLLVGVAVRRTGGTSVMTLQLNSDSNATVHVEVKILSTGAVQVNRGAGGTQLGVSNAGDIPVGAWGYLEVKATLHDSTGAVTVRWNGAALTNLTITGADTKNGGTKTVFDTLSIAGQNSTYIDDLYLCNGAGSTNNDLLGDVKIETLYPSGNGNSSQLTGSDGNSTDNYLLVDETPPNTSDYTGSATNDQYDTYAMDNLATASGTVFGINVWAYAAKSDAGTKGGAIVVRSGGTDYEQTDTPLGTGYAYMNKVLESDPATSAAWTITNVNAIEAGFKVKAS